MIMLVQSDRYSRVKTRCGLNLEVRPASPADWHDILKFLEVVSSSDLRFRFLAAVRPSEMLARLLADVDHCSREDLIAFDARDGSIAATAMIAEGDAPDCAEIAVLVRSDLKGNGIGWAMLLEACDYAREKGYRSVECVESSSNERAIELEREQGFVGHLHPDDAELTILKKALA
jgi:acetyltransferase